MKKTLLIVIFFFIGILLLGCTTIVDPIDEDDPIEDITNGDDENDVDENDDDEDDDEIVEIDLAESILKTLSLEQKVGQMFIVGFSGTTIPTSLVQAINDHYFGNFIYFASNLSNPQTIASMSTQIQETVVNATTIPGFISADQEGGMVARLTTGGTHFIGNMALGAIGDDTLAYEVGQMVGKELRHYGINLNLAPVLDVNNNPANPIIGVRSYSDNPVMVSDFGIAMIQGMRNSNVLATAKHFPGHGDTHIDSHYGLPTIPYDLSRLYDIELYPYIQAIEEGLDAIMTAHILFSAIDNIYPATLSYKVITELLREALGYQGIVMTDAMNMDAIRNHFGNVEASILAIQAGVDILTYTESTSASIQAYRGVLDAVENGIISEARIDESVMRILNQKIKYGLFNEYLPSNTLSTDDFLNHKTFNNDLAKQSLTLAKGEFSGFDANKSTLIISTINSRYAMLPGFAINASQNSLAYIASIKLEAQGFTNVHYQTIGTSISSTQIQNITELAKDYEQVVVAFENATVSQGQLTTTLFADNPSLVVVALRNPYDILRFPEVETYICVYGYLDATVYAIIDYLSGGFNATGVLPVIVNGIND